MIVEQFNKIHAGRDPELIQRKRSKMSRDPIAFFRGSPNLFYKAMLEQLDFQSPWGWVCGDLHIENFGTFKGLDNEIYFDINDFDEANWGQIHRDLIRLMTSIAVTYKTSGAMHAQISEIVQYTQDRYVKMLLDGKVGNLHEFDDVTLVQEHIDIKVVYKDQKKFIAKITKHNSLIRSDEFVDIPLSSHQEIEEILGDILHHFRGTKILDIARHVCGNSSLGLRRYAVLIQGHKKDSSHILDLKEAASGAIKTHSKYAHRDNDAERIVSIQKMMQADSPFLLSTLIIGNVSFVIKEIQPTESKIVFGPHHKHRINKKLIDEMIHVLVHDQLSACDILGSVTLPEIMEYAQILKSSSLLTTFALQYTDHNEECYNKFCEEMLRSY